jgi:hypothetical protein
MNSDERKLRYSSNQKKRGVVTWQYVRGQLTWPAGSPKVDIVNTTEEPFLRNN